jgi:uncharacterized membrane protein
MLRRTAVKTIIIIIPYFVLFLILSSSLLAPLLEYLRLEVSKNLYAILHSICNQMPTRSLFIYTSPMAICARCFFIYSVMFITGLALVNNRNKHIRWKAGLLLMIPCIIDGSSQYLGFRLSNNFLRSMTGALAGLGIALILFPLYFRFVDYITERRR